MGVFRSGGHLPEGGSAIMPHSDSHDIDRSSPPFDQFTSLQRLSTDRSGHGSVEHVRHQLYVGRHTPSRASMLVKVTSKPGLVYEQNLTNEIASLTTINRELPDSRYFPVIGEHGRLRDGRVYLTISFFDEFPLATTIGPEPMPDKIVAHLRTAIEVAKALAELHRLMIVHVDLNPMNILYRAEKGRPVIRIVDFESSYEHTRHSKGAFYSPPMTAGYSAPEVSRQAPDARSDLFSLGAVLYTMLAGYRSALESDVGTRIEADRELDPELKGTLLTAVDSDPDQRYPSVREFQAVLADHLERIWPGRTW
jgi:serine/threonine protein kinase